MYSIALSMWSNKVVYYNTSFLTRNQVLGHKRNVFNDFDYFRQLLETNKIFIGTRLWGTYFVWIGSHDFKYRVVFTHQIKTHSRLATTAFVWASRHHKLNEPLNALNVCIFYMYICVRHVCNKMHTSLCIHNCEQKTIHVQRYRQHYII